jgi:glycosyltransferase involved in cell wall biosynthesis
VHSDKFNDQVVIAGFRETIEMLTGAKAYIYPTTHFFDLDVNGSLVKEIDTPLLQIIEQNRINILHGQALYAAVHVLRVARDCNVKTIFDIHGILPEETAMRGGNPDSVKTLENAENKAIIQVDLRIMVSESMNSFYIKKYGLPELNHLIVPCCVHSQEYFMDPEKRDQIRQEKDISEKFVILYLGTLSVWQWPEAMFSLFGKMHNQFPECYFYLLIPQTDQARAVDLIKQNGIPENCFRLEEVTHNEVGNIIGIADAGILLREKHPVNKVSSPTKFGEYLAGGIPVLLTEEIGDYSDMAENYKIGLSIRPDGNSVSQQDMKELAGFIADIRQNRTDWAQRCMKTAYDELNWNIFGKKLAEAYRALVKDKLTK